MLAVAAAEENSKGPVFPGELSEGLGQADLERRGQALQDVTIQLQTTTFCSRKEKETVHNNKPVKC